MEVYLSKKFLDVNLLHQKGYKSYILHNINKLLSIKVIHQFSLPSTIYFHTSSLAEDMKLKKCLPTGEKNFYIDIK